MSLCTRCGGTGMEECALCFGRGTELARFGPGRSCSSCGGRRTHYAQGDFCFDCNGKASSRIPFPATGVVGPEG
jgi:hypothetical protein